MCDRDMKRLMSLKSQLTFKQRAKVRDELFCQSAQAEVAQAQVLDEGLSVHAAAKRLHVAPSTAFRWRHRYLAQVQAVKARVLIGIAEADEAFILRSNKGERHIQRKARRRGGKSSTRGSSDGHVPVLVARDRSGACTDFMLERCGKARLTAALMPVLAPDVVLCTDGSSALAAAARLIGVEHHALNMTSGARTQGPWHIQNVNAYHGRLKAWIRRFHGVATKYLASYLGWFRALDRVQPRSPAARVPAGPGYRLIGASIGNAK